MRRDTSVGRWGDNGTFAWKCVPKDDAALKGNGSMVRRTYEPAEDQPNYRFFQGVAVAWLFVAAVVWLCYEVARLF